MATTAGFILSRHVSLSVRAPVASFFLETSTCVVPSCRPPVTTGRVRLTRRKKVFRAYAPFFVCCDNVIAAPKLATNLQDLEGKKVFKGYAKTQEKVRQSLCSGRV